MRSFQETGELLGTLLVILGAWIDSIPALAWTIRIVVGTLAALIAIQWLLSFLIGVLNFMIRALEAYVRWKERK